MTPKRMTPSKSTTSKERKNHQKEQTTLSKEKQIHSQETTLKRFQNNVKKRFKNDDANDTNWIETKASFIREIKLTLNQNGHR